MKSKLIIRIGTTNDAPIFLEFEPQPGGETRVWLKEDQVFKGYATVYVSDLRAAVDTLEAIG